MRGAQLVKSPSDRADMQPVWLYRSSICPCGKPTIQIGAAALTVFGHAQQPISWRDVYPIGANRGPVPPEVPAGIADDYIEACNVLTISAKASAALSRRCLQNILHAQGYRARDLAKEIDAVLSETDAKKAIPQRLRDSIDGIRNFGNFSAHPVDDKTTLQVIDVEPHEAEWCLEILEEMFQHYYVGPAEAKRKKDALDAKLAAARKPPSK
jgi:hypothetical protein